MRRRPADPDDRQGHRCWQCDEEEHGANHGGVRPARPERVPEHVDGGPEQLPVRHRVERPVQRLVEAQVEKPHDREQPEQHTGDRRDGPDPTRRQQECEADEDESLDRDAQERRRSEAE